MKVGIIGAGNVGRALGAGLSRAGHGVVYGVRDPDAPRHRATQEDDGASCASVQDAVALADAVILATPWPQARAAIEAAGGFGGKPLLDATNPVGPGPSLLIGHNDSGGEQVARWATSARVVKVFNTTGFENMRDPAYPDGAAAMFLCGDDDGACKVAATLATALGFDAIHVGRLDMARVLEPAALLWINLAIVEGHGRDIALGVLREGVAP